MNDGSWNWKNGLKNGIGNWAGLIFGILLFGINTAGITGAFFETLLVDWRTEFSQPILWGGLFVLGGVSVLWWPGKNKPDNKSNKKFSRWAALRTIALVCVYAEVLFLFRETIINGFVWSFRNALEIFHEYYGGGSVVQYGVELLQRLPEGGVGTAEARTLGFLTVLFPACMLTGFFSARGKWQVFLVEDILWFTAACLTDVFPGFFFLALCVMGIVLAAAAGEFQDSAAAWLQAAVGIMAIAAVGIVCMERFMIPVIEEQYKRSAGLRHSVYVAVNYKWLPELQRFFHGSGFGAGVDVTGTFGRQSRASGIMADIYRVTLDTAPLRTLYLRGFVGMEYDRRKWEAEDEGALQRYYDANGFSLYEDGREILNIGYATVRAGVRTNTVTIEELLGDGRYSLLPYGAMVTEDFHVHNGETVDRIDSSYSFRYRDMIRLDLDSLAEQWKQVEEQYRQYAYASFLDYPEERLPQLTRALDAAMLPKGDVYGCAQAIIQFLEKNGSYRLDVAATPVGKDLVEHFLFESHEGYCAHFASAAVLMFRYCGIPARYATGYSVSPASFTRISEGVYTANLTGAQAHAWAEIYVDGVGWVPVEATPGAAAFAADNRGELLRRLGIITGDIEPVVSEIMNDDDEDEEEDEEDLNLPAQSYEDEEELEDEEETEAEGAGNLSGLIFRIFLIALPAGAVCIVLFGRVRRLRWNRKLAKAQGHEKICLLYRNMRSALWVMGCPKKLILTGQAFWEKLEKALPSQSRDDYDTICAVLEQSSFGNRVPSGEEIETLGSLHDDLISRLYLNAPFYKKPAFAGLACFLPASFRTYSLKWF